MGRNFYKVLSVDRVFSFSLGDSQPVYDWLSNHGFLDVLSNQGSGFVDVGLDELEQMLDEVKIPDVAVENGIREDIRWAKERKMQFLTYEVM